MKIRTDPLCHKCGEEEQTSYHFLGRCSAMMTARKCMFYFVILRSMSINGLHLCLHPLCRLLHCCFAANR